jgi:hypothetical protein
MVGRQVALRVFAVSLFFSTGATAQVYAWWVTARFVPGDTVLEGIPISKIQSEWERASVLTDKDLPSEAQAPGEGLREHGFAFSLDRDLNGDGINERAVAGVYRTREGAQGRFLLVLGKTRAGVWSKSALFVLPGEAGFSALAINAGKLIWVPCMECDEAGTLEYANHR